MISYERVRELFEYDPEEGVLYNKTNRRGRSLAGSVAGNPRTDSYLQLCIDGKMYRVNRIVWLWYYGYLPENLIDHKDQDKTNNRIDNLREASKQCNTINVSRFKNNTSGIRGVSYDSRVGKWFAQIKVNKKKIFLTQSTSKLEAACARLAAEQCLGWDTCTRSSAYEYVRCNINSKT